ncbi:MAG: hypothetical protein JW747_00335 [Candidatus Aminicenantes bacterium]|nr:hypothetical protein [Candidatus Aminicenantes bacterium]
MIHRRGGVLTLLGALFLVVFPHSAAGAGPDHAAVLIERLIGADGLDDVEAAYLRKLTPPLFDYLRSLCSEAEMDPLYRAGSTAELRALLAKQVGPDVLDFGGGMFDYFEQRADKGKPGALDSWRAAVSDRFVFFYRPGSRAEEDAEFLAASSEEALSAILAGLDMRSEALENAEVLHVPRPPGSAPENDIPSAGKISVFLHPGRASAGKKFNKTMGAMSFGATILSEGADKGAGRLTARIDVLYLNALSLAVLHHEIAHAALFLGSFDAAPLAAEPLQGKADLRKAFFDGYKPIPPFLQEGIGDYIFYYRVLTPRWPLLASPGEMMKDILGSKECIPLAKLIREGAAFRSRRRKAYSLEAATVVDYLIRSHGPAKLKAWLLSPEKDGVGSFEKTFGYSVAELESRWKASLLGEPGT